jgi:nucleoid-associated protein YgaU
MIGLSLLGLLLIAGVGWRLTQTNEDHLAGVRPTPVAAEPLAPVAPAKAVPAVEAQATTPPKVAAPDRPSFDIVRVSPQGSAVIAGRATPNAEVTVRDNGQDIGHAQANQDGQFVVLPERTLSAGGQELTLTERAPGKPEVAGDAPVVLVVPGPEPAKSDAAAPPVPTGPVAVLTPTDAAPRVLQSAPSGEPAVQMSGKVGLDVVDYDEHGGIRFAGTGAPGSVVRLYVDNSAVGEALVDAMGRWGLVPLAPIAPGDHHLRVDDIGGKGQVTARVELPFQRAALSSEQVQAGQVIVQPGQNLWRIARHAYGQGIRYTVIYRANRSQIRNADLIYPGQVFAIPTLPDATLPTVSTGTSASSSKSK